MKPTTRKLTELGFKYFKPEEYWYIVLANCEIHYSDKHGWDINDDIPFVPLSIENVKTLINMLQP